MPHYPTIVHKKLDVWCVWSTIVDAPIRLGTEEEIKAHFRISDEDKAAGKARWRGQDDSMTGYKEGDWCGCLDEETQTAWIPSTPNGRFKTIHRLDEFRFNRAGPDESPVSISRLRNDLIALHEQGVKVL